MMSKELSNLYLSMLHKLGVPSERFGDSTGKLEYLPEVRLLSEIVESRPGQ